jgi:predicted permease
VRKTWQAIWNRSRFEDELSDELRFHLEARAADLEKAGHSRAAAIRLARLELGAREHYKEACRQARGLRWLDELRLDLLYAFRGLNHNRVFAAVAILTLTLGIGANACIFTLVNSVLLKTLPVDRPEELQAVYWALQEDRPTFHQNADGSSTREGTLVIADMFAYPHFVRLRSDLTPRGDLFAHASLWKINVTVHGQAQLARGLATSWNYFRALGVSPVLGRTFLPEDEEPGSAAPALLSHSYWRRAFAADPGVLGRALTIADGRVTIVGILPPEFRGLSPGDSIDVFVPLTVADRLLYDRRITDTRGWWVQMMARVHPGVSVAELRSEIETRLIGMMRAEHVKEPWDPPKIRLVDGRRGLHWLRTQFERPLRLVMAVALLILLMSAVNVSGLLLARSEARAAETGARLALGAGRLRVARQHLTESLLLAMLGLAGGLTLAAILGSGLPSLLARRGEPPALDLAPDATFLTLAVLATVAVAILFALYPAWKSSRLELTSALKRTHGARTGRLPMGRVLVGAQVALSLVLLIAAAMFLRTVSNLRSLDFGFVPERLLVFGADPTLAGYDEVRTIGFYERAIQRLASTPGVRSVALSRHGLLTGGSSSSTYYYRDPNGQLKSLGELRLHMISPGYFDTVGLPLLEGRDVRASDTATSQRVVLVNQKLARALRPDGGSPVGLDLFEDKNGDGRAVIAGVVGNAKYDAIRRDAPTTLYAPFRQRAVRQGTFSVRTVSDPLSLAATVRRVMAEVDSRVPIYDLRTQEEQISLAMERERILAKLLAGFGSLALILAAIGIYGVLSYSVTRRTSEIGIRLALGAAPAALQRMIVRESLLPVAFGLAVGLCAAWWFTQLLESFLFGIKPMDGWSVAAAVATLAAGAALAAWIPAHRASRVAPLTALRYE